MMSHVHGASAKAPLFLGDARMLSRLWKGLCGVSRGKTGLRSAVAVTGSAAATPKGLNCFRCGEPRIKQHECRKQVSAGVMPGSEAGTEKRAPGLPSNGEVAAGSRRRIGDKSSLVRKEQETGRPWSRELAGPVVAIERLSDALERHNSILHEGRRGSIIPGKKPHPSLRVPPRGGKVPIWRRNPRTTCHG